MGYMPNFGTPWSSSPVASIRGHWLDMIVTDLVTSLPRHEPGLTATLRRNVNATETRLIARIDQVGHRLMMMLSMAALGVSAVLTGNGCVPLEQARAESPAGRRRLFRTNRMLTFGTLIPIYIGSVRNSFAGSSEQSNATRLCAGVDGRPGSRF
jgi:hypothetical protein